MNVVVWLVSAGFFLLWCAYVVLRTTRDERDADARAAEAIAERERIPWRMFSRGVLYGDIERDPRPGWAVGVERLDPLTGTVVESERIQWFSHSPPHPIERKEAERAAMMRAVELNTPRNRNPTDPNMTAVSS